MVHHKSKRYGFEIKLSDNPTISRSMTIAMQDLELEKLFIVFPDEGRQMLRDKVERTAMRQLPSADFRLHFPVRRLALSRKYCFPLDFRVFGQIL